MIRSGAERGHMIVRATLALMLATPILAGGLTPTGAAAATTSRKDLHGANTAGRDRMHASTVRQRGRTQTSQRQPKQDARPAIVATLDDGLAYDTPRDASGQPLRSAGARAEGWQIGTASWYGGSQWQGRRMSDGTRYQEDRLTAAHASLPLGSLVRVTLVGDTRSVVVQITDRPGTRRRVIDLSRGAAAQLGMLSAGVAQVRLDPL